MARTQESQTSATPIVGVAIAIAVLYFARELLIPFAFALLFAFLLGPIVKRLEGWHIPRIPSAILVLAVASALVAIVGWVVVGQFIQIAESLPRYRDNISRKVVALQGGSKEFSDLISSLEDMEKQMLAPAGNEAANSAAAGQAPMPVRVVEERNTLQTLRDYGGELLKPLGTAGLIAVFTLFMLIDRENLRNRLLRLMGQQKLQATTKAMDDAGYRVSRYVLMQFAVNAASAPSSSPVSTCWAYRARRFGASSQSFCASCHTSAPRSPAPCRSWWHWRSAMAGTCRCPWWRCSR